MIDVTTRIALCKAIVELRKTGTVIGAANQELAELWWGAETIDDLPAKWFELLKPYLPANIRFSQHKTEIRHPGHADQSIHNPHKNAGSSYAAGQWKEIPRSEMDAIDNKLFEDVAIKSVNAELINDPRLRKAYDKEVGANAGRVYANGNVTVRFGKNSTPEQEQRVLSEVDVVAGHLPKGMLEDKDFPIDVSVTATGLSKNTQGTFAHGVGWPVAEGQEVSGSGGVILLRSTAIKPGILTSEANATEFGVPFNPASIVGTQNSQGIIAHEMGHAASSWLASKTYDDTLPGYTVSRFYATDAVASAEKTFKSNTGSLYTGIISHYAKQSADEKYAEHFSEFVIGDRNQWDPLTEVLAKQEGWIKP